MKHTISWISVVAFLMIGQLFLSGCSPWATYPPVETKMAQSMTRETFEPVPTVMVVALQYGREKYMGDHDVAINLPLGTPAAVYEKVIKKLGWGRPMMMPGEEALNITEVRTRGFNAQVDMIYRRSNGLNQLVTLDINRGTLDRYKVTGARAWQMRDLKEPMPNYVPPPEPEPNVAPEQAAGDKPSN